MIEKINCFLKKYREPILYLVFGALTTAISFLVSNGLFYLAFRRKYNILSNVISETAAITFAFVTNKWVVFRSKTPSKRAFFREFVSFYAVRSLSAVINIGAMKLFVDVLSFEFWICKLVITVGIVVLNYIFSKFFIFNKKDAKNGEGGTEE